MKIGTVRVSEEFIKPDGTKKWFSHERQYDMDTEDPLEVFAKADAIMTAFAKSNSQGILDNSIPPGPPTELPVINKAEERLGILIENATTPAELMAYKDNLTTPYLADLFSSKHQQLLCGAK